MPTYWFNLKTRDGTLIDPEGTDLPNDASAYAYAETVARSSWRPKEQGGAASASNMIPTMRT
jgi:hypothetical protein